MTKCYFEEGYLNTSVYLWEELLCGHSIQGPAIIIDKNRQAFPLTAIPGFQININLRCPKDRYQLKESQNQILLFTELCCVLSAC